MVKTTWSSSNSASEWGQKGDSRDFELGVFVCPRQVTLSISETVDVLGFSHTTISGV